MDREAQALADGDLKTFLSIQDQRDQDQLDGRWVQSQIKSFQAWGRPLANMGSIAYLSRPLYTIVESGTLSPDQAWADVIQFHNEQYFRGTRFYRQMNGQWLRIRPNLSFWSGQYQSLQTKHFEVIYPVEDSDLIGRVADRFETAYARLCADLNCSLDPADASSGMPTIKLFVRPDADRAAWAFADQRILITLPSPRVIGMYNTSDDAVAHQLDDPVIVAAYDSLLPPLAQIMSGGFPRWILAPNQSGWFFQSGWTFLQAVIAWERNRVSNQPDLDRLLPPRQLANNIQFVQLETLWAGQTVPSNPEQVANSVVVFIEQKFGTSSVGKFLKAIGPAHSFARAIEASLGVDAAEFEQQWKDWLRGFYASASQ